MKWLCFLKVDTTRPWAMVAPVATLAATTAVALTQAKKGGDGGNGSAVDGEHCPHRGHVAKFTEVNEVKRLQNGGKLAIKDPKYARFRFFFFLFVMTGHCGPP
jgi:hypothetical protein